MVKYRKMCITKIQVGYLTYYQVRSGNNILHTAQSYKEAKAFIDLYRGMWG